MAVNPSYGLPPSIQPIVTYPGQPPRPGVAPQTTQPGGGGGLPPIVFPSATGAGSTGSTGSTGSRGSISQPAALQILIKKYPKYRPYLAAIRGLASQFSIDDVYLLASIINGNVNPAQFATFAHGLGQHLAQTGILAPGAAALIPTRYVGASIDFTPPTGPKPKAPKLTPEQQVQLSVYKSQLRHVLTDPWVTIKNGKIILDSKHLAPPKGSLGIGYKEFQKEWGSLNDIYQSYIGRKAKAAEVAAMVKKGWSTYQIQVALSKTKAFRSSPIWKAQAPGIGGVATGILGDQAWGKVPAAQKNALIRQAIIQNWTQATLEAKIRALPQYLNGTEFLGNKASLGGVYQQIFGITNDPAVQRLVGEAALAQWSPDQFASYLRGSPGYTQSDEFKGKALGVLSALGAIAGSVGPALRPGPAPPNPAAPVPGPPNSPRLPGAPGQPVEAATPGLVAGFA